MAKLIAPYSKGDMKKIIKLEVSMSSEIFVRFEGDRKGVSWELKKIRSI